MGVDGVDLARARPKSGRAAPRADTCRTTRAVPCPSAVSQRGGERARMSEHAKSRPGQSSCGAARSLRRRCRGFGHVAAVSRCVWLGVWSYASTCRMSAREALLGGFRGARVSRR